MRHFSFGLVFLFALVFFIGSAQAQNYQKFFLAASQYAQEGDYDKAIEFFEKAIEANPNFAPGYNFLGLVYQTVGLDIAEVAWYFKAAVDIDPSYEDALMNLGKAYYTLGHFDLAQEYISKALVLNPQSLDAKLSLAWNYLLGKSRPLDAVPYFKEAALQWKQPGAYFGLGLSYFMIGENARVLECITALREMKEEHSAQQLEMILRSAEEEGLSQKENFFLPGAPAPAGDPLRRPRNVQPSMSASAFPSGETRVTVSGTMPVRLRGQFIFDEDDQEGSRIPSPAAPDIKPQAPRLPPKVLKSQ